MSLVDVFGTLSENDLEYSPLQKAEILRACKQAPIDDIGAQEPDEKAENGFNQQLLALHMENVASNFEFIVSHFPKTVFVQLARLKLQHLNLTAEIEKIERATQLIDDLDQVLATINSTDLHHPIKATKEELVILCQRFSESVSCYEDVLACAYERPSNLPPKSSNNEHTFNRSLFHEVAEVWEEGLAGEVSLGRDYRDFFEAIVHPFQANPHVKELGLLASSRDMFKAHVKDWVASKASKIDYETMH